MALAEVLHRFPQPGPGVMPPALAVQEPKALVVDLRDPAGFTGHSEGTSIPNTMPNEIRAFFETYRDAFNALDGSAVAELYAEPSGIAQDSAYTHWPSRRPIAENMTALCKLYEDKGFVRADFEAGQFIDQGPNHAVADLLWRIDWHGGQEPWRFKTTYNLVRTAQGWQVLLCTAYAEATLHKAASADNPSLVPSPDGVARRPSSA